MFLNKLQINPGLKFINQASRGLFTGTCLLAGHSKWANIRHIKGAKDAEKSALFGRYSRQMRLAIQDGGSANPKLNSQLQSVIDQALKQKMPNASIQNVLKKYSDSNQVQLKKFVQDIKALGKVYMVTVFLTENVVETKQTVASRLKKFAGAAYTDCRNMFEEKGLVEATVPDKLKSLDESALEEACTDDAIECGAEEVEIADFENKIVSFACNPIELERFKREVTAKGYSLDFAGHVFIPKVTVKLSPSELENLDKLKSTLKEIDGVEEFFDNVDYS